MSQTKAQLLDGKSATIQYSAGSASSPAISFTSDTNTGIYSPGADQVAISTNGTGRVFVTSTGVGVGTTPGELLHVYNSAATSRLIVGPSGTGAATPNALALEQDNTGYTVAHVRNIYNNAGLAELRLGGYGFTTFTSGSSQTERARIDSSGRLLVGTSTSRSAGYGSAFPARIQIETSSYTGLSIVNNTNDAYGAALALGKSRGTAAGGTTAVSNNDEIGTVTFAAADGTDLESSSASITCFADAAVSGNDVPGRLVFSTTADGASSPTERGRVISSGYWKFSNNGSYEDSSATSTSHYLQNNGSNSSVFIATAWNNSYATVLQQNSCLRAANSAYSFFKGVSGNGSTSFADNEFDLRGDGNAFADGSWTGGGADYAEYFEWSDFNPNEEDRRGISVVLDGDKIREAQAGEDPIGVISGNPSVVGDSAWNKWSGKYLRDEFGTYIQEDYEATDDDGNTVIQQRRKLNPAYDPDAEYVSREERPEWDCVGLMGKLRIRKGQVTGSRWIKMRDINDSVEEWLVR